MGNAFSTSEYVEGAGEPAAAANNELLHLDMASSPPLTAEPELVDSMIMARFDTLPSVFKIFMENKNQVVRHTEQIYEKDTTKSKKSEARPDFKIGNPSHGSYHILIPLEATDVAPYLYKVPLDGTQGKWDSSSERSLRTEAETMKRLFNVIPVPYVYDFSATTDNAIGCPFIVISEIMGIPLYDVWFGHQLHPDKISLQQTREHRARALEGIAEVMVKLSQFSAKEAGAPVFNEKDELVGVETTRVVDRTAKVDGTGRDQSPASNTNSDGSGHETTEVRGVASTLAGGASCIVHGITSIPASIFGILQHDDTLTDAAGTRSSFDDDELEATAYADCEPTNSPRKYYTRSMDLHPQEHEYSKGVENFLRLLISCIPEPDIDGDTHDKNLFVLSHPDFDIQNFIVKPDGTLMGIIDWDGVETVPRSVGNLVLPGWLTRDWDPILYVYEPLMGNEEAIASGYQPESLWEDSEHCLAEYRDMYATFIARYASQGSAASVAAAENTCRRSLLTENLAIAASDPVCRAQILEKVVSELWSALRDDDSGVAMSDDESMIQMELYPTFYSIAQTYFEGDVDEEFEDRIRAAFIALLERLDRS